MFGHKAIAFNPGENFSVKVLWYDWEKVDRLGMYPCLIILFGGGGGGGGGEWEGED